MGLKEKLLWLGTLAGGILLVGSMAGFAGLQLAQARASSTGAAGRGQAPILSVPVKSFRVENANMAEALLALRSLDVDQVVIGLERMPHLPGDKGGSISLALTNATVGQIVQGLCQADPRYEYEVVGGMMVEVRPQNATTDPGDLLNLHVRDYKIDANIGAGQAIQRIDEDASELRDLLRRKHDEWVRRTGEREGGSMGSIMSGNMSPPRFTLQLHDVTVRQILDAISLKSIEMFRQGPDFGPNGMPLKMAPVGWEYDFVVDPDAPTGLGGYPKWTGF